jgi:hypothetical protein
MADSSRATPRFTSVPWRSSAKAGALVLLLGAAPFAWVPTIGGKTVTLLASGYPLLAAIYSATAVLGVATVIGAPFLRYRFLRWPLVSVILLGFIADFVARLVLGQPLSSHMMGTLVQSRQDYRNALGAYHRQLSSGVIIGAILAAPLLMRPSHRFSVGLWFIPIPVAAWALTFQIVGSLTGRVEEFPAPIAAPAQLYFGARESDLYAGARDDVRYTGGAVRPRFDKILFIVDESVRADYLELNNPGLDDTPFLTELPNLANFGVAVSYANCSQTSRVMLRSGARQEDIPDPNQRVLHQPTFWQFAKRAGYRTVHIDAWEPRHPMANFQTYDEQRYIDEKLSVSMSPYWRVDDRVAELVWSALAKPGPVFAFVEKIGVHTPYAQNIAPHFQYDPKVSFSSKLSPDRRQEVVTYLRAIRSRVDRFFQQLSPLFDLPGVLVIYTSDHGQSMFDGGYDVTSCSGSNAVKGEGLVPLFLISGSPDSQVDFQAAARSGFNRATHSDIFPTLLSAMGFEPQLVQPPYRSSLTNIAQGRLRRFFVFSPFTNDIQWVKVD